MSNDSSAKQTSRFRVRAQSAQLWRLRSDELHTAACLVWFGSSIEVEENSSDPFPFIQLYRPAQLLMGLSLEALLKGLIIAKDPRLIDQERLPKTLKSHSLPRLCELAKLDPPPDAEASRLLVELSDAVEWVAKYPVPVTPQHLKVSKHGSASPFAQHLDIFPIYEALRERIQSAYP